MVNGRSGGDALRPDPTLRAGPTAHDHDRDIQRDVGTGQGAGEVLRDSRNVDEQHLVILAYHHVVVLEEPRALPESGLPADNAVLRQDPVVVTGRRRLADELLDRQDNL